MKNFARIRRLIGKSLITVFAATAFAACDDVPSDDRYIELPELQNVGRNVLLQDFTGQNCVNCPSAHETMELLMEQYGENLICVSVHAGGLSMPVERTNFNLTTGYVGLATDEGDAYNDAAAVKHWPMGTVDRGAALDPDLWGAAVRRQLETEPAANIAVEASISDGKITISSDLLGLRDFSGKYTLWVVESGIVARQRGEGGLQTDYVHNHVFRTSVNGTWGEDVKLQEGIHTELSHSIELRYNDKERWQPENLSIVAFISDDSGVQQAAQCKVSTENE